jgi:uncharacterized membrane protein
MLQAAGEYDFNVHAPSQPPLVVASAAPAARVRSIDIVRGAVMVLMAIDHVRVYAGVPAGGPWPGVFFTRWVTHFCAPVFVFLAGTAAFLHLRRHGDRGALARYLLVRGLMLVALELTVIRFSWTFNWNYGAFTLAGVIWMLGWCMILMAGLIWLPVTGIAIVGALIVVAQPVFTPIGHVLPAAVGDFLYLGGEVRFGAGGPPFEVLYVIVPWIGVMALGYAFGRIMTFDTERRRKLCLRIGITATLAYVMIAAASVLRQSPSPGAPPALFRMLSQRKYPASPLFLLMTLGPTLAFLPYAERMRGRIADFLSTFGRVPMFFYLLHIPLIHASALVVSLIREARVDPWLFGNHPMNPPPVPDGYRWSLPLLYLVFAVVIALLYWPCKRYAAAKARRRSGLLRFI